jgi:putative salt-induced outer membrane protein YdiY
MKNLKIKKIITIPLLMIICVIILNSLTSSSCSNKWEPLPIDTVAPWRSAKFIIYDFDESQDAEVEWLSLQGNMKPESKTADAKEDRNDIYRSNDTLFINLYNINDSDEDSLTIWEGTGKYIVVLKHTKSDKMFIKLNKTDFEKGCAKLKWGGWLKY